MRNPSPISVPGGSGVAICVSVSLALWLFGYLALWLGDELPHQKACSGQREHDRRDVDARRGILHIGRRTARSASEKRATTPDVGSIRHAELREAACAGIG